MEQEKYDLYIRQKDIMEYMWERLLVLGYVPSSDELLDISEIMVLYISQFLIDNKIIEELDLLEEEEDEGDEE